MTFMDQLVGPNGQASLQALQQRDLHLWQYLFQFLTELIRQESPRLRALYTHIPPLPPELGSLNISAGPNGDLTVTPQRPALTHMDVLCHNLWHGVRLRLERQLQANANIEETFLPRLQAILRVREDLLHQFNTISEDVDRTKKMNFEQLTVSKKRYQKLLQRVVAIRQQYTNILGDKGRVTEKHRSLEAQWTKKVRELHLEHNLLLLCLHRYNTYQRLVLERIQPALVNYTESVMRLTVEAVRKLLEESSSNLDVSLSTIRSINPAHEYDAWLSQLRIEFEPPLEEQFPSLPEDYVGPLRENTLQVDEATCYELEKVRVEYKELCSNYMASISKLQRQSEQKHNEIAQLRAARQNQQDGTDSGHEYTWLDFNSTMEVRLELYQVEVNLSYLSSLMELEDNLIRLIPPTFPLPPPQMTAGASRSYSDTTNPLVLLSHNPIIPKLPSLADIVLEKVNAVSLSNSSSSQEVTGSFRNVANFNNDGELLDSGEDATLRRVLRSGSSELESSLVGQKEPPLPNRSAVNAVWQGFRRSLNSTLSRRFKPFSGSGEKRAGSGLKPQMECDEKSTAVWQPAADGGDESEGVPNTAHPPIAHARTSVSGPPMSALPSGLVGKDSAETCRPEARSRTSVSGNQMSIATTSDFTKEKWFHGVLPREEISRLLQQDGDFLVRCSEKATASTHNASGNNGSSSSASTNCTWSRIVLSVYRDGARHFIIQQSPTTGHWFLKESHGFSTLSDLIQHYYSSREPILNKKSQTYLLRPVLRPHWQLDNDDIVLGRRLGRGNFGDVFYARFSNQEVAVKTCRADVSHEEVRRKFLQGETTLLNFNHPNIVRLLGIAVQKQPIMIVMEFVPDGALNRYVMRHHAKLGDGTLLKMVLDVGLGMEYLEAHKCIHRDLAARNCLVDGSGLNSLSHEFPHPPVLPLCVKIADFGLARCSTSAFLEEQRELQQHQEEAVYQLSAGTTQQIPVKWTAPEVMRTGRYTSLCDVWAFGILLWEVYAAGETPYPNMTNAQAREYVDKGYRMPAPPGMPPGLASVMELCWNEVPEARPRFHEITGKLHTLLAPYLAAAQH